MWCPHLGGNAPHEITAADIDAVCSKVKGARRPRLGVPHRDAHEGSLQFHPRGSALARRAVWGERPTQPQPWVGADAARSRELSDGYAKPRPRTRTLRDDEIRGWAGALDSSGMRAGTKLALKLILVTAQRPGEVRRAERACLQLDGEDPVWIIPPEHSKNGSEHRVPLSPLAVSLFKEALTLSGSDHLVFPNPKRTGEPVPDVVLLTAQANLFRTKLSTIEPATAHDLRRTAATGMRRLRVDRDTVSLVLNHASTGVTARHYDHHEGEEEKREALTAWSAHIQLLCGWRPSAALTSPSTGPLEPDPYDCENYAAASTPPRRTSRGRSQRIISVSPSLLIFFPQRCSTTAAVAAQGPSMKEWGVCSPSAWLHP